MRHHAFPRLLGALLALLLLTASGPARNVKIATYNVAFKPFPESTDRKFSDEDGVLLTNVERAGRLARRVLASDVEVLALNEVFDEDARDELVRLLEPAFPYFVAYIGNDTDPSDSGLMLFSRLPFQRMRLDSAHVYDCGDVEIGYAGTRTECSDERLGFREFTCSPEYGTDSDCLASKGVALVKLGLPHGDSLYVGFSHFLASYPSDLENLILPGEIIPCAKARDRQEALRRFQKLLEDAVAEDTGDLFAANVVLLGDLNVNGNPFHGLGSACLDAEWAGAFRGDASLRFTSCADHDLPICTSGRRVLVDAWNFTTSTEDLGRSSGFDFALDLTDAARRDEGERLDYVLLRGPVKHDPNVGMMIPQHLTLGYPLAGSLGGLSDHLPVAVDLLMPGRDRRAEHSTPREARSLLLPVGAADASAAMAITSAGQMQWLRFEGEPGTYTLRAAGAVPIGFDIYRPIDLSRPIAPRRERFGHGFVYLLDDPPYFVRTFAAQPADRRRHDRNATAEYTIGALRHNCTSPAESCILSAGATGRDGVAVEWPVSRQVNLEDAMWFDFYADDPNVPQPPTVHYFAAEARSSGAVLPELEFQVVDLDSLAPLSGVSWRRGTWQGDHREMRADGIRGKGAGTPTFVTRHLKILRPPTSLGATVSARVTHGTNLSYMNPLTLSIEQEDDASARDELRIYLKADSADTFYRTAAAATIHDHAGKFQILPEIDELEDGGSPWPAAALGALRVTAEVPLLLIEDDDEDGDPEPGDFLLALPDPANPHAAANGFAIAPLPVNEPGGSVLWRWTDLPDETDPDDTSYLYTLRFELTKCPPTFTCRGTR